MPLIKLYLAAGAASLILEIIFDKTQRERMRKSFTDLAFATNNRLGTLLVIVLATLITIAIWPLNFLMFILRHVRNN